MAIQLHLPPLPFGAAQREWGSEMPDPRAKVWVQIPHPRDWSMYQMPGSVLGGGDTVGFDCLIYYWRFIGGVQPIPRDLKDKEIFVMLDDIWIANKKNPLSKSSNMVTMV